MEEHTPNQRLEKHNSIYSAVWIDRGKQLVFKAYKNVNGHLCWILIYVSCLDGSARPHRTQSDM